MQPNSAEAALAEVQALLQGPEGPSTQDAIAAIVSTEGNMELAAERLFGPVAVRPSDPGWGKPHPKSRLTALLTADPTTSQELQRILRTLSLIQAFSTFQLTAVAVEGSLDRLSAEARVKLYKQLLDSIATLTDDHTATVNANNTSLNLSLSEAVIRSLPADVLESLSMLNTPTGQAGQPGQTSQAGQPALGAGEWSIGDGPDNAARGT